MPEAPVGSGGRELEICCLNMRSMCNKFPLLSELIRSRSFAVVALTETWLRSELPDSLYHIPGYKLVRHDRIGRAGGVAFYIDSQLKLAVLKRMVTESVECLLIKVQMKNYTLGLAVVYRPDDSSLSSLTTLSDIIISFFSNNVEKYVILGDFNVNLLSDRPSSKFLKELLSQHGCIQLINDPTRVTDDSESLLDLVITNVDVDSVSARVMPESFSDHNGVSCRLGLRYKNTELAYKTVRSFKDFQLDSFLHDLSLVNWDRIYYIDSLDSKVDYFNQCLLGLYDEHAPLRVVKINSGKRCSPWFTDTLKIIRGKVRSAWRRFTRTRLDSDKKYFTSLRNYYNKALVCERRIFFSTRIEASRGNSKLLWQQLRKWNIRDTSGGPNSLPVHLRDPDLLNDHFVSFFQSSNSSTFEMPSCLPHSDSNLPSSSDPIHFRLQLPDIDEVCLHTRKLKPHVSGIDGISGKMLQVALPGVAGPLTHIINSSFERGALPRQWKVSAAYPIPKKNSAGKKEISLETLRPISILPACLKIAESIYYSQFIVFVENCNILSPVQSGFRKGYSTTTALCNTLDDIISSADRGQLTYMTLLDLSKAFDSVSLTCLVRKLEYYGVAENSLRWLSSYLFDRVQHTVVNTSQGTLWSRGRLISSGVPQGSVLGPLLFSLYVASLPTVLQHCSVQLFADDIQLYLSFPPHEATLAEEKFNTDIADLVKWLKLNSLVINPLKCQGILFGSRLGRHLVTGLNVCVDGFHIPQQQYVVNLGVVMDSDLSFSRNVSQICQRAYFSLKQLLPYKYVLDSRTKLLLCESLVLSLLNYADVVYGPCITRNDDIRLQKIQNLCVRYVMYIPPFSHVTPYLRSLNCLKVQERRLVHYTCFLNSILNSELPAYLYDKMSKRSTAHKLNLRHVDSTFIIPKHSTSLFKCSFSYLSTYIYNNLLSKLPKSTNVTLKRTLRSRVLNNDLEIDLSKF